MWHENLTSVRIGEEKINKWGEIVKIVKYDDANNIIVQFENGHQTKSNYNMFSKGNVGSPYNKTIFGVGYLGEGDFLASFDKKLSPTYIVWRNMFVRCYDKKYQNKNKTYKNCTVCDEWHNFQMFAKWYDDNYYKISGELIDLDKDILSKGNKIYSPETCCFVPHIINTLFVVNNRTKYPTGVTLRKGCIKYTARCGNGHAGKRISLGTFSTLEEAFSAYKKCKEEIVKIFADKYKDKIPQKLYDAMYKYEVEITD